MKKFIAIVMTLMLCLSAMTFAAMAAPEGLTSLSIVGDSIPGVKSWDLTDAAGKMTEVSDSVYEITLAVKAGTNMKFKFAGNQNWDSGYNLGSAAITLGTVAELTNDGGSQDMSFAPTSDITVKITVDLKPLANGGNATVLVADASGNGSVTPPPAQNNQNTQTPPTNDVYRVVGNAEWMGNWDAASDKGLMTSKGNGVYSVTFKNVAAGDYEMKVTANGSWDKCWGDGANNKCFSVSEACDVTVEFTLKGDTGVISVSGKGVPQTSDVSMMGVVAIMVLSMVAASVLVLNKKKFF
jgi:hypothetical protein